MRRAGLLLTVVALLGLTGCASVAPVSTDSPPPPAHGTEPAGTETPSATGTEPATERPGAEAVPLENMSSNRAVVALLDRARLDAAQGQGNAAGAALERALRIEPRNPWLWHQLARLRLQQGQYPQAIALAQKSNTFARRERMVQALNWHLIGDARIAQGNSSGAAQAKRVAEELERQ